MSRGGSGHQLVVETAWPLLDGHQSIERRVEEIEGGVRTETVTSDPELVPTLRRHVAEMTRLMKEGGRIRGWDPLFAELFDHADLVRIEMEEIEGGVAVTETSSDPEVVKLIRAHAAKVGDFSARGHEAYREETPLPAEYRQETK
jgi:hypothetical protein